jgi:hypothetical protein
LKIIGKNGFTMQKEKMHAFTAPESGAQGILFDEKKLRPKIS